MKRSFFLVFTFFSLLVLVLSAPTISYVFAQQTATSGCVITNIGQPDPKQALPAGCGSGDGVNGRCGSAVDFAQQINDNLNPTDSLNKDITSPCGRSTPRSAWVANTYWCVYTVVDSYNLAGIAGLSGAAVQGIHKQFASNPALIFVDYRTSKEAGIKQVKPGWAFIIEKVFGVHTGAEHTGIIKTITLDERGNGTIVTLESNGGDKSSTWPIANWEVKTGDSRPLVGFGGVR